MFELYSPRLIINMTTKRGLSFSTSSSLSSLCCLCLHSPRAASSPLLRCPQEGRGEELWLPFPPVNPLSFRFGVALRAHSVMPSAICHPLDWSSVGTLRLSDGDALAGKVAGESSSSRSSPKDSPLNKLPQIICFPSPPPALWGAFAMVTESIELWKPRSMVGFGFGENIYAASLDLVFFFFFCGLWFLPATASAPYLGSQQCICSILAGSLELQFQLFGGPGRPHGYHSSPHASLGERSYAESSSIGGQIPVQPPSEDHIVDHGIGHCLTKSPSALGPSLGYPSVFDAWGSKESMASEETSPSCSGLGILGGNNGSGWHRPSPQSPAIARVVQAEADAGEQALWCDLLRRWSPFCTDTCVYTCLLPAWLGGTCPWGCNHFVLINAGTFKKKHEDKTTCRWSRWSKICMPRIR